MNQLLDLLQGSIIPYNSRFYNFPTHSLMLLQRKYCLYHGKYAAFQQSAQYSRQGYLLKLKNKYLNHLCCIRPDYILTSLSNLFLSM